MNSNSVFVILIPAVAWLLLLSLLWGPSLYALTRLKARNASLGLPKVMLALTGEFLAAAGLALLADKVGFLNPAGYTLAIVFTVSIVGAVAIFYFGTSQIHTS